ncbi:rab-GTPase-TBC domain-containing protein [Phycomyces nitens]|nr:rab-GTPase-TBC domain-containing protein [Phycomyces nitens]
MISLEDDTGFVDLDIDAHDTAPATVNLTQTLTNVLSPPLTDPTKTLLANLHPSDHTPLTADRMLDELSETTANDRPAASLPLRSPHPEPATDARQISRYDQFFEEVSLDLPRDSAQQIQPSSSKLLKFIPRRTGTFSETRMGKSGMMTPSDVAGPFYSISDVLDDTSQSTAHQPPAKQETIQNEPGQAQRGARRNVFEAEVIVQSGGSSGQGLQRRTSKSLFGRKSPSTKPSPLDTVISKTRPRMLPPKNKSEEKKHLQEHEAMMKKARKLEAKKQKENDRKKEEKDKKTSLAVQTWETDIFPQWSSKIKERKTQELWIQGVPPRCRRKVWLLAIGNHLGLSKDTFVQSLRRVPLASRPWHKDKTGNPESPATIRKRIASASYEKENHSAEPIYRLGRRRTSSLNVLHEDEDGRQASRESLQSQQSSCRAESQEDGSNGIGSAEDEEDDDEEDYKEEYTEGRSAIDLSEESLGPKYDANDSDSDVRVGDGQADDEDSEDDSETGDEEVEDDRGAMSYLNKTIDEDILRTLPSLCVFQPDGPLFGYLQKVLHAYVGYRDTADYPRGASFLAGMLLLNMGAQDTFASLTNLIHKSDLLSALYSSDEQRVKGYFKIFNVIFAENLYKLYLHFQNLSLTPDNYLPDWFMTLFASIMPLELSSRLWDIFLLQGDVILFKTGLAVLKYLEPLLWGGSFGETVKILNMGFVGEERGEEVKAALAVSGNITEGEQDLFFDEVLGKHGIHLDSARYNELIKAHVPPRA